MIRNGNVELQAREEEIRFLKMQLAEEKRSIQLLQKSLPNKRNIEGELVTLQIQVSDLRPLTYITDLLLQLAQCQDRMMEMEKQLENPMDESRARFLGGRDLTPAKLHEKLEELEVRLAEKEESMLEKDLVFEQVCRLVDRIRAKADSGKDDTLKLAKNVNDIQSRIKEQTRKMMAMVSELSMHQGNALRLQQQVKVRSQLRRSME
jgi:hypothetical protein